MKKILSIVLLAVLLVNCTRKVKDPVPAPTEITSDTVVQVDQHSARNSLDYIGMYKGKLPCADCAGVEVSLQLSEGFSYTLTRKYLGKSDKVVEQKGRFSWNQAGNAIILDKIKDEPNQYFVGENSLTQLDMTGNKVVGKLAESYVLRKLPEAEAAKTDAAKVTRPDLISDTAWKLTEINGKIVGNSNSEREFMIEFKNDQSFSAFAGCNRISGKYESKESKIKLFNIISTRMACADMTTEAAFIKALESADNFVANKKVLQLRKGGNNVLKFDPIIRKTK